MIKPQLEQQSGEKEMFFFGEKNKNRGNTPDENTLFEIGSINKTMTGAILAHMTLQEKVNLDDAVEDYLPGIANFPDYQGQKIQFQHLANHTSSLPRLADNGNIHDIDQPFANYSKQMMYEFLDDYTLPRPIGSEEEYSNLAFGLLGHTLGEINNSSFDYLLHTFIFDQLGMQNTYTYIPSGYDNIAQPHNRSRNATPMWDFSDVMLGAGGIKSSLKDMLLYLEANMGYGNSTLKEALAFSHENTQMLHDPVGTGLAWVNARRPVDNTTFTHHNGGTLGSIAFIGFIKELDVGVVLLFNCNIAERSGEPGIEARKCVEIIEAMQNY